MSASQEKSNFFLALSFMRNLSLQPQMSAEHVIMYEKYHNCDASLYVPAVGAGGKIFIRLLRGWKTVCEHVHMCIFVMEEKV